MKNLIVVGGGGFAREVVWLAQSCGFNVVGVLDDSISMLYSKTSDINVLGKVDDWDKYPECSFVVAIGSPRIRKKVVKKMGVIGSPTFTKLIHPNVVSSNQIRVGEGAIICAGSIFTVDIDIGNHCIVNLNSTVGHESVIGDFVTIAPLVAVSGNVCIEDYVEIGTGASIRQGLKLGQGSMLAMGSVLTKNLPANMIYAGTPAKKLRELPAL